MARMVVRDTNGNEVAQLQNVPVANGIYSLKDFFYNCVLISRTFPSFLSK